MLSEGEEKIIERLDLLIQLQIPSPYAKKAGLTGVSEKAVYGLCDLNNTREDIAKKLNKKITNIDVILKNLRSKGIIKSVNFGGKTGYVRLK